MSTPENTNTTRSQSAPTPTARFEPDPQDRVYAHPANSVLTTAANFNPSPRMIEQILTDASDTDVSIHEIARKAGTTIEAIILLLARPDIAARLDAMESVFARRCRLHLASNTPAIMTACSAAITHYNHSLGRLECGDNPQSHAILNRKASNALLASRILIHLGKHHTRASAPRAHYHNDTKPAPTIAGAKPTADTDHTRELSADAPASTPPARFRVLPSASDLDLRDFRDPGADAPAPALSTTTPD